MIKPFLALATAVCLISCATIAPPAEHDTVDHVVLMWQKHPGNSADRQALLKACAELRGISGIQFLDTGTALASERPIVDDSFDIGLIVRFDSEKSLHAYETSPLHLKKVNEVLKPLTKKIVAYDIVR
jgi:Stress responsive A/B Barrel Domain